ncbi:MAG: ubiquitin-like small modifier protein 1 [Halodesulfurarchaeum sp.]
MQWKLFADLAEVAGTKRVPVDLDSGATVADAVDALLEEHPDLAPRIRDEDGGLADHVNLLRNGENVFAAGEGLETPVNEDDELALFPPVSGG